MCSSSRFLPIRLDRGPSSSNTRRLFRLFCGWHRLLVSPSCGSLLRSETTWGFGRTVFFATVFLGSGLVYLAMILVCAAIARALLLVLETEPERVMQSGAYAISRASTYEIYHIYAVRIAAVFMTSVSTAMLRAQIGPRVLAFLGYVLALVLLFGVETLDWASLAFLLWALLISVLIMIRSFRRRSDTVNESVLVR